jgi:hypothetical protein
MMGVLNERVVNHGRVGHAVSARRLTCLPLVHHHALPVAKLVVVGAQRVLGLDHAAVEVGQILGRYRRDTLTVSPCSVLTSVCRVCSAVILMHEHQALAVVTPCTDRRMAYITESVVLVAPCESTLDPEVFT